jgi:hypothetical protein
LRCAEHIQQWTEKGISAEQIGYAAPSGAGVIFTVNGDLVAMDGDQEIEQV